ncbi:hypothetical protein L0152_30910 [bacterium]|nr:hypothetical protein [bacterium]
MTKIGNTGTGGIRPPGPDSTENVKETVSPKEAIPVKPGSANYESVSPREATGDKYAAGDLKSAGDRVKTQLDSKLAPKSKEVPKEIHPGFAPPYVPVGPVVPGDAPTSKDAPASKHAPAKKDAPNQPVPGFAPPYVPVGPVVMGDNIPTPGAQAITGETKQMNLKPDQFQINDQGNLVITNEKLIEFFKSLKENAAGGDINIGIRNLKTPDKE